MMMIGIMAYALAMVVGPCSVKAAAPVSDVNRPIATAEVPQHSNLDRIRRTVAAFADRNHFALQPVIGKPQGAVVFSTRLFRDDISLMVTQLRRGPIQLSAYPLCICDLGRRVGLQEAADASVKELKNRLR